MNKKGFTLVELLAVIIILGVILSITIPSVERSIDKARTKTYATNEVLMINAARLYMADNINLIPNSSGETVSIELSTLIKAKTIKPIKDAKDTEELCSGRVLIEKETTKKYKYYAYLDCPNYTTNTAYLNANNIILEISDVYNSGTSDYTITITTNTASDATALVTPTSTIPIASTMTYTVSDQATYDFYFIRSSSPDQFFQYTVD
ncbi:MAG: prepilin-type N-terminal cleavage/methylation domain-containing protein [Bacilli bacterium]|nr:prepilin-type N-terminal cleavage/methylation domain-containing protein [Bacilli bacterium]